MQVSKTQTIRLANVLGMDISNQQDQVGILDSLNAVSSPDDFIEWVRNNRDTIEYSNRREKLTILHTRYKNTIDNIPISLLEDFSKGLADKFKIAIQILRDNEEYLTDRLEKLKDDGIQYFTNKEVELLNATGGLNRLICLYELGTLYDALYNKSVQKTISSRNDKQLTNNQKKVKALIGGVK